MSDFMLCPTIQESFNHTQDHIIMTEKPGRKHFNQNKSIIYKWTVWNSVPWMGFSEKNTVSFHWYSWQRCIIWIDSWENITQTQLWAILGNNQVIKVMKGISCPQTIMAFSCAKEYWSDLLSRDLREMVVPTMPSRLGTHVAHTASSFAHGLVSIPHIYAPS